MDPLAHTLAGACLAEAGLKRTAPLAASTLIVAAVVPDVDAGLYLVGADIAFLLRRGWTHGVVAWLAWPAILTAGALAFDAWFRRRRDPGLDPARAGPLFALAALGVLSHVFLDWFNTYGIRFLSPLNDRWFYGDTLFIVDPWLWAILGGGVAFAWSRTRAGAVLTAALAAGLTALVWLTPLAPASGRVAWGLALASLLAARRWAPEARIRQAAPIALALGVLYIAGMFAASRAAEARARGLASSQGWVVEAAAAMPEPFDPLRRTVIVTTPHEYLLVPVGSRGGPAADAPLDIIPRGSLDPVVAAALESPRVRGTRAWLRFPSYEVQERPGGAYRVTFRDARFALRARPSFGVVAIVDLDRGLRPTGQ